MTEIERIDQLREELHRHNYNYYVLNAPEITDQEFDKLMRELQDLEEKHPEHRDENSPSMRVGSDINKNFTQVVHKYPMLSLANTYSETEVTEFYDRVKKSLNEDFEICCEMKYDGTSISLTYENGKLVRAVTRGDGVQGDDVTGNVKTIRSIPLVLHGKGYPETFEIRGEILMPWVVFEELNKEREATFRLEEFLKRRYEFRFNTVLDEVEYRQRDSVHFYFKPLDKRTRNSIALCALKEGLQVWDRDIDRFLTSDFVPLYNPVEEYLCDLPRWDGTDRIRALARLVPCGNPHWEELFYRWFLGMVAHWRGMDRQHGNSTSPLLVGSQGFRKSTYCRNLLPPELRFGYADSLDFSSKQEAERALDDFSLSTWTNSTRLP